MLEFTFDSWEEKNPARRLKGAAREVGGKHREYGLQKLSEESIP